MHTAGQQHETSLHSRNQRSRRRLAALVVALAVTLLVCRPVPAQEVEILLPEREAKVKCALLYSFVFMITWPANAFPDEDAPLVIGVLGERPHLHYLDRAAEREVRGRKLVVKRYRTADEIDPCHVLFVTAGVPIEAEQAAVKRLAGTPALVVGERPLAKGAAGTHIHFVIESQSVKFLFNLEAAKARGLQIDPRLLKLARTYPAEGQP